MRITNTGSIGIVLGTVGNSAIGFRIGPGETWESVAPWRVVSIPPDDLSIHIDEDDLQKHIDDAIDDCREDPRED